jgi:hypothetical protein
MGAARPVFRGDVGALQMKSGQCRCDAGILLTRLSQGRQSVHERGKGIRDERGAKATDAMTPAQGDDTGDFLYSQSLRIETAAVAAIDLEIKKSRRNPSRVIIGCRCCGWSNGGNPAAIANDLHWLTRRIVSRAHSHREHHMVGRIEIRPTIDRARIIMSNPG